MTCNASPSSSLFSGGRTIQFNVAEGERLKAIGNELYQRGKYVDALNKYTEGAKNDPTNPLIYANRAAVHLAMKRYARLSHLVWVGIL
jgi:tetratricopeptide (TPR) repeat protein